MIYSSRRTLAAVPLCVTPSIITLVKGPLSRDVGSQVAIGVAVVTQWQEWPYLFTKKSQKLALFLVKLAKDSLAGPTYYNS
jgi:hypothetical protein